MAKYKTKTLKVNGKTYNGSNSTTIIDKVSVYGKKNTVKALKGNDIITIYKGGAHKIYGGDGKDTISIGKNAGEKIYVDGGKGNDKIIITGGGSWSNHKIHGGAGNDTIIVSKGNSVMRSYIYGEAGDDTITVNGGAQHKIYGGAGADTIRLVGSGGDTVYTGGSSGKNYDRVYIGTAYDSSATVTGSKQKDYIAVNGGYGHKISTGAGNDVIKIGSDKIVVKGSRSVIKTGAGNDSVTAINATGGFTAETGAGNDTITVNKSNSAVIRPGTGTNTIKISNTTSAHIYSSGETALNKITISGGKWNHVDTNNYSKTGTKNQVTINSGTNHTVHGTPGKDVTTVNGGSGHVIYVGCGNNVGDTVTVNGGKNITLNLAGSTSNNVAHIKGGSTKVELNKNSTDTIHIYSSSKQNSIEITYHGSWQLIDDPKKYSGYHVLGDSLKKRIILHDGFYERPKYYSDNQGGTLVMGTGNNTLTIHGYGYVKDVLQFGEVSGSSSIIQPLRSLYIQYA